MRIAVVPFAVVQRHRRLSFDAHDYINNLNERERAARLLREAQRLDALRCAEAIEATQASEGIRVHPA